MHSRAFQTLALSATTGLLLIAATACDNRISITPQITARCFDADECFRIGARAEAEPPNPDSSRADQHARAVTYFDAACDLDHAKACVRGSMIHWIGPSPVTQDPEKSFSMMQRSCELNHAEGCGRLGTMYDNGSAVQPSRVRALELYKEACTGGYPRACADANRLGG